MENMYINSLTSSVDPDKMQNCAESRQSALVVKLRDRNAIFENNNL